MLERDRVRLTWAGYCCLTLNGIYIAALGPGLPAIARRTGVDLSQAGTLLTAIFAGGLITCIAAGRALDHFGRRPLIVAGTLINGAGCLLLAFAATWFQAEAAALLLGIGDAMLLLGTHVLFADLYPEASGAALNRLNVFFGLGALAGPTLAGASLLATGDVRVVFLFVALVQVMLAVWFRRSSFPGHIGDHDLPSLGLVQVMREPLLWLLAAVLFVYVGLEIGLGNWTYTYLRAGSFGVFGASVVSSLYWLSLALGRALSPFVLRRLSESGFLLATVVAATLAAAVLVAVAGSRWLGAPCILLIGFSFGPVWPLVFAAGTHAFRRGAGAASGVIAGASSVGGLFGPWLQGALLNEHGARAGMSYTLVGCTLMTAATVAATRRVRHGLDAPTSEAGATRSNAVP